MKLRFELYTRTNQIIVDGLIFVLSFGLAYGIRFEGVPEWPYIKQFLLWLPYVVALRLYVNWRMGIYRFIWRYVSLADALAITRSLMTVSGVLLAFRVLYPSNIILSTRLKISLTVIALEFLISLLGCLGARVVRRLLYQRGQRQPMMDVKSRRVLLIGAGRAGVAIAREFTQHPEVKLLGFLDDDPKKIGSVINGIRVWGSIDALPSVALRNEAEEVIVCIPRATRDTLKRLWALADHCSVRIKIVPTLEEVLRGHVSIAAFREIQMGDLLGREMVSTPAAGPDVTPTYRAKRILITGAGGSIGSELATQLLEAGPEKLILLDKDENGLYEVHSRLGGSRNGSVVCPVVGDIRFPATLRALFEQFRPEVVFHAAAHKHVPLMELNPCEAISNNVIGTRNLVEIAQAEGALRFVFISTDKAVKPSSIMGASKRVCEMIVQTHAREGKTSFACVRFGNVMGSRGSVIPFFQQQIARGGPVTVTHPEVKRFLMTIPEAVRLVIQAGTLGAQGEIFILDMGDPIPIVDLAKDLIELSGLRPGLDIQIETTQLRPGEKLNEELIDSASETLAPTSFEKVRVVQSAPLKSSHFKQQLTNLEEAAISNQPTRIYRLLRELGIGFSLAGADSTAESSEVLQAKASDRNDVSNIPEMR